MTIGDDRREFWRKYEAERAGRPKALGMHIYSGLWTYGFMDEFNVVGQWEEGPWGSETAKGNLGEHLDHRVAPIEEWPVEDWADELDLVYANCPCAPWSAAGAKKGFADSRLDFSRNAVRTAIALRPQFFALESVPRAFTVGRALYEGFAEEFRKAGYATTFFLTNGVLHGAPQFRQRFHLIAHKLELQLDAPDMRTFKPITVRDAIGDIESSAMWTDEILGGAKLSLPNHLSPRPLPGNLNVMKQLNEGEGWDHGYRRAVEAGEEAKKGRFISGRLRYDAPAQTMVDISCVVHPTENRFITAREGARLCGYPDWYRFAETKGRSPNSYLIQTSDLTQAVLPYIGRYLGKVFNRALDLNRQARPGQIEVVDFRPMGVPYSPSRYRAQ